MKKSYDFSKGKRGAVIPTPPGKTRITIRIDEDVLEWFRKRAHEAGGLSLIHISEPTRPVGISRMPSSA